MRLAILLPTRVEPDPSSWQFVIDYARACDRAGVDRVLASDHVAFGERLDAYSRPENGGVAYATQRTGPDGSYLEPMTTLAAVSTVTERVRLGTCILLAALRRPVVLAKTTATLDVLSGGRLDLGVGVGWQREEYEAAGLAFDGRGRLLDHALEVCRTLWLERRASYASPELAFEHIHAMPKPVQPRGVPIWCSGRVTTRVAQRIARFGTGWITWDIATADLPGSVARMRDLVASAGGAIDPFSVQAELRLERNEQGSIDVERTMSVLPGMVAAGVTDAAVYQLPLPADRSEATAALTGFVEAFRSAAGREPVTTGGGSSWTAP